MTSSPVQRVVCYAPYNLWTLHGLWEMTVLHALRMRGIDLRYVLCDGLYSECDMFWASTNPRHTLSCSTCQAHVTRLALQLQMPYEWLGRYLLPHELRLSREWADAVSDDALTEARYGDWEIGAWVRSSVHSHFRASSLDLSQPEVAATYRGYLMSGAVAAFGLERLFEDARPDVLLLFSGRMGSTRVAFELARRRRIRVICHERGLTRDSIRLFENAHALAMAPVRQVWNEWGEVPLHEDELERVCRFMEQRARGENLGERRFSPPLQDLAEVRTRLGLCEGRTFWVLFTSSEDEVIATRERAGPFPRQIDWIRETLRYVRDHPEIELAIRVHPNIGSARSIGVNRGQLAELEALRPELPANARLIGADDPISSYSLMELADAGLVYISITGLELACRGKPVAVAAGAWVRDLPFVETVQSVTEYPSVLDRLRIPAALARGAQIARQACRFAYGLFFRWNIPLPLVRMRDAHNGDLAYDSLDALAEGRCAELDRICRIVLEGEPVCTPPDVNERRSSDSDELQWMQARLRGTASRPWAA